MTPRPVTRILFAALTLALAGCAPLTVNAFADRAFDLRQSRTFAWDAPDGLYTGDPRLDNNRFFDERVRAEIESGLARRGLEKSAGAPDVLVHYHARFAEQIDLRELDRRYGTCEHDACRPEVYDAGTIVVDLVDRRTNRLVWRGWAEGAVDGVVDDQVWMEQHVAKVVASILARLPARV